MPLLKRIDEFIQHLGVSYNKFENIVGASRGGISAAIRTGRNIGINVIENILQEYPELNSEWLLRGNGEMLKKSDEGISEPSSRYLLRSDKPEKIQRIPLYNLEASAGLVAIFEHFNENVPSDYLTIPNLPKCDGAVFVTGDSMYPLLKSGDMVIYKQIQNIEEGIFWGEMYLISIELDDEEFITVKYIQKSDLGPEYIKLVSQNGHHQPMDIKKERLRALAMVKASVRINSMR